MSRLRSRVRGARVRSRRNGGRAASALRQLGGPAGGHHRQKTAEQGKLPVRERVERAPRRRLLPRGRAARELGAGGAGRRRGDHRPGEDRRAPGRADGQRPDRQGRLLGAEDGGEDPPRPGAGAGARGPDPLPGRLRRGADHRPGADVSGAPRRRSHLLQRGAPLRPGAAGLPAVRAERRRWRLHPGLLRRRDHARRQRLDVSGLAADGGDGDRREGDAGGDGRGEDAHRRLWLRPLPGQERRGGDRARQAATSPSCRASWREQPPPAAPPAPASEAPIAEIVPADENQPFDMREVLDALLDGGLASWRSTSAGRRS